MRGVLLLCAALAAAAASPPPPPDYHTTLDHIKAQILAKLGLSARPTPVGAPPRDVVRRILQHASDDAPRPQPEAAMREVIAIAHTGLPITMMVNEWNLYSIKAWTDRKSPEL